MAILLRVVAALSADGWFASDDYLYVIEPAWRWLDDPTLAYPSAYRSPALAVLVAGVFRWARAVGLDAPTADLHFAYLLFGLWSCLALPAVYRLARSRLGEAAARQAVWLMAAYVILPGISTRALIEVVCIPPLVWGLALADEAPGSTRPGWQGLAAGACLGLATLIRFHVGLVFIVVVGWLAAAAIRRRADWLAVAGCVGGGVVLSLLQGGMDLSLGRKFLGTPLAYLAFNLEHSSGFGTSPWYTYLLQLVVLTLPPATFWLAKPLWCAGTRHRLVAAALVVFVAVHSLVAHKEDRFLFPVLPLFLVLLGAALAELARHRRSVWLCFWGVNVVALMPAILANPQQATTAPLLAVRAAGGAPAVALVGYRDVPAYYLGRGPTWTAHREPAELVAMLDEAGTPGPQFVLSRVALAPAELAALAAAGVRCGEPATYQGDLVDRLLLLVNPEHNRRRRPTTLWRCRGR